MRPLEKGIIMNLVQTIEQMSDEEVRDMNRVLGRKLVKYIALQVAWRTSLVVGTHMLAKRIARKLESPKD